jgi:hypothetical protein
VWASFSPFGNSGSKGSSTDSSRPSTGGRATDTARVARFKKELSASSVNLGLDLIPELAYSVPLEYIFPCFGVPFNTSTWSSIEVSARKSLSIFRYELIISYILLIGLK